MADKQPPVKVFRIGNVSASVFVRTMPAKEDKPERQVGSVCLQKSYVDDDGNRQYTNYFNLHELVNAAKVLELATAVVVANEAEVRSNGK